MPFPFEKLIVYQKSLNWAQEVMELQKALKRKVSYSLIDQISRAALSIALNIAEGNGRWHRGEKRNFFWIARGSAFECIPILQLLKRMNHIDSSAFEKYYQSLEEISKMLTKLIQSVD